MNNVEIILNNLNSEVIILESRISKLEECIEAIGSAFEEIVEILSTIDKNEENGEVKQDA